MKVRKLLSLVLAFAMILSSIGTVAFAAVEEPVAEEIAEEAPVMAVADGIAATVTNESTGKNESYDDIDDAFAALKQGDTVTISEGIHYLNKSDEWFPRNEEFWLPDDVTIIGEEGAVIQREPVFFAKNLYVKNVDFLGSAYVAMKIHGKAKFEDCIITGPNGIYYSTVSEKLEFVNCTVKGDVYGLHVGEGTGDVIVDGCTISGWNTFGNIGVVEFKGTKVVEGPSYNYLGFYQEATFDNCTFDPVVEIGARASGATITLKGCTVTDGSSVNNLLSDDSMNDLVVYPAKIGDTYYETLQDAFNSVTEADTTIVLVADVNEGSIKMPANITNLTIDGQGTATIKDTTITAADGSNIDYNGLTFNGIIFDNSNIVITGWRANESFKNLTFTNNVFKNIERTGNMAAVHLNNAAAYPVDGLTFTGNVIDGVSGSSNSGIYTTAVDGKVVIENNTIKSVTFRPFVIQVVNTNGTADSVIVKGNTLSDSPSGRIQILGTSYDGTDNVNVVITNNVIHNVTNDFELCCWKFNDEYTEKTLSGNYWGSGVEDNYGDFYWNGSASSNEDLVDMGIYPIYTALKADGTIDETSVDAGEKFTEAKIGDKLYSSLGKAIEEAEENDVIVLYPGNYSFENGLRIKKSVTITGDPNYGKVTLADNASSIVKPVINITEVADGGVKYQAENVAFDNIVFNVAENATRTGGYYASALGYHVEDNANRDTLTLTNCDFINNSSVPGLIAVMAHIPNYTVTGCTFENFSTGIYTALDNTAPGAVNVSDNTYANVSELFSGYWGKENAASTVVISNNKATDKSTTVFNVYDYAKETIGADATAFGTLTVTNNDAKVILTNYDINDYTSTVENNTDVIYTYKSKDLLDAIDAPEGKVYVNYGRDNQENYLVAGGKVYSAADIIAVELENVTPVDAAGDYTVEDERIYNINLNTASTEIINRLNSADLTFILNTTEGTVAYEVIASNEEVEINPVYNPVDGSVIEGRYEFHYAGKDNVKTDTDTSITIGKIKVTGYGTYTLAVDANAGDNAVHTTTLVDNIVKTYFPAGNVANGEGKLDITGATDTETIVIPTRNLVINVAFPNAIKANSKDYQDMTITVTGPEGYKTVIDLADGNDGENLQTAANGDVYYSTDDANTAAVEGLDLTLNTPYTVTVEGAGYRTVKYTVNMTEDKTLNFWNNVKDNAKAVEVSESGVEKYAQKVTFLAGDIVKDNDINVYDLSAVVSYFGEIDLDENNKPEYAKYDLNRDGKIDSKDVAYVLVSWGN